MIVTIFRSRLRADGQDDYETMAARTDELAAFKLQTCEVIGETNFARDED